MKAYWYAPPGEYCKDHTIIKKDNTYHLFSISGISGTSWYYSEGESKLSHSISTDLKTWSFKGHVVEARGEIKRTDLTGISIWREDKVWAPHCIQAYDKYWMFYCGLEQTEFSKEDYLPSVSYYAQRICLATSSDLETWTQHPEWVFAETGVMTSHAGAALRDPMVLRDEKNSQWLMYVTMFTEDYCNAVGVLISKNLYDWAFEKFVYIETKGSEIITESPFVSEYNGKYYLFVNRGYSVSDSPMGPFPPCRPYIGEQPGWGAGENFVIDGKVRRSLIGGEGLIVELGNKYGGQLAVFDLEWINGNIKYSPLSI